MASAADLWLTSLDHLRIDSPHPEKLCAFYRDVMGMPTLPLGEDLFLAWGPQRRMLIGRGAANGHPFSAWRVGHREQLVALREKLTASGAALEPSPTPLFQDDALAVRDPDGRLAVFGLPRADAQPPAPTPSRACRLPGRLQHVVVASPQLERMRAFYRDTLGFLISDTVYDNDSGDPQGKPLVHFYRGDNEHHSLAVFTGSTARHDHHCFETTSWNDLRDWLDALAEHEVFAWWGPGRHGPGNNVFFMIKDPDGNNLELSAELEVLGRNHPQRAWPNTRLMYNLWGVSWIRS
jgi:catechol 2,3-dioxygenase